MFELNKWCLLLLWHEFIKLIELKHINMVLGVFTPYFWNAWDSGLCWISTYGGMQSLREQKWVLERSATLNLIGAVLLLPWASILGWSCLYLVLWFWINKGNSQNPRKGYEVFIVFPSSGKLLTPKLVKWKFLGCLHYYYLSLPWWEVGLVKMIYVSSYYMKCGDWNSLSIWFIFLGFHFWTKMTIYHI